MRGRYEEGCIELLEYRITITSMHDMKHWHWVDEND